MTHNNVKTLIPFDKDIEQRTRNLVRKHSSRKKKGFASIRLKNGFIFHS